MAAVNTRVRRMPRKTWSASAAGCLGLLGALAPSRFVGHAFVVLPASTSSTVVALLRQRPGTTHACCATAEGVEGTIPAEDLHADDHDADDDDEIHPSVAWLYQTSTTPTRSEGKKPFRRTLAVDYGTQRVGLAIGVGISPRVVPGITNCGSDLEVARQVLIRARGEGIRDIVVGLPLVRNGTETEMCGTVRSFATVLAGAGAAARSPATVYLWDERFSSAQAEAMLDRHGGAMGSNIEIDSLAASLILEHYFSGGGSDNAEHVEPGIATAEIMFAAGRTGQETDEGEEEDLFGEDQRRRMVELRAESIRSAAAGGSAPMTRAQQRKRKRRRR